MNKGTKKICQNGHVFYKSSDCPTCPTCEEERKPKTGFLSELSTPARRALENAGITTLTKLATYSQKEILTLHGMGPASLPILQKALSVRRLKFRE